MLGDNDGVNEGELVGGWIGDVDGGVVGALLGDTDGVNEGDAVGGAVGALLGGTDGWVGDEEGDEDGAWFGEPDGAVVAAVGDWVGAVVLFLMYKIYQIYQCWGCILTGKCDIARNLTVPHYFRQINK